MPASKEPQTLRVSFHIDGKTIHERVCNNILFGDVWYVASPQPDKKASAPKVENSGQPVRIMLRKSKRAASENPARFSVSTSFGIDTRFSSIWEDATNDFASALGHSLAKKSGRPTGIIHMTSDAVPLGSWIPFQDLKNAPSLMADYENLAQMQPGQAQYEANVRRYIAGWKTYWGEFIPQMIATRAVPNGEKWGSYPKLDAGITSKASMTHNTLACSFIPGSVKGILFVTGPAMVEGDQAKNFSSELGALANSLIRDFGGKAPFYYTMPAKDLAPAAAAPTGIKGEAKVIEIKDWKDYTSILEAVTQ